MNPSKRSKHYPQELGINSNMVILLRTAVPFFALTTQQWWNLECLPMMGFLPSEASHTTANVWLVDLKRVLTVSGNECD